MDALQLKVSTRVKNKFRKAESIDPPENTMEWTMRYMADVQTGVPKLRKTDS
ncbi:MAG: hypothetical protein HOB38_05520 [Deltaproteobacteria bacterium]|nr:hypothetical protein [Deltaproteobacteria bacterium]